MANTVTYTMYTTFKTYKLNSEGYPLYVISNEKARPVGCSLFYLIVKGNLKNL